MNAALADAPVLKLQPVDWKSLATAYNSHHFNCRTCRAAGRGMGYGLRCETGAGLWSAYQEAAVPAER